MPKQLHHHQGRWSGNIDGKQALPSPTWPRWQECVFVWTTAVGPRSSLAEGYLLGPPPTDEFWGQSQAPRYVGWQPGAKQGCCWGSPVPGTLTEWSLLTLQIPGKPWWPISPQKGALTQCASGSGQQPASHPPGPSGRTGTSWGQIGMYLQNKSERGFADY
ncbi:uncharacterized protein LOC134738766 [Pongo pygmaeus]|uniref:uncharacterized protein LOC134738766 n=1 Tax=Pongo pygmaeus TaxID=9600 RepID=UPI00300D0A0A